MIMGSQRIPRQHTRSAFTSHLDKQLQKKRLDRRRNTHRRTRHLGANSVIELVQLQEHAAADLARTPEGE